MCEKLSLCSLNFLRVAADSVMPTSSRHLRTDIEKVAARVSGNADKHIACPVWVWAVVGNIRKSSSHSMYP